MVSAPLARAAAGDDKARLRLWVRLLRLSRSIEGELRERFKTRFESTLPRFDVMAALWRAPDGMMMSELSRFLLVSNGNVTGIVDRLVADGLVTRAGREGDRRASVVHLTQSGRDVFTAMADAHAEWIDELLGGIAPADAERLAGMLAMFRSTWEDGE